VRQPQVADTFVPSLASRQNAPAAVQPLLNALPLPNGRDLGGGTAAFSARYSDPSTLNSAGLRIDYLPLQRVTIFGRYSDAPSSLNQRGGFSHPNFGPPTNYLSSPLFGQSTQMLGPSLGSGGQNGGLNPDIKLADRARRN